MVVVGVWDPNCRPCFVTTEFGAIRRLRCWCDMKVFGVDLYCFDTRVEKSFCEREDFLGAIDYV